jgi:hypothetical protein
VARRPGNVIKDLLTSAGVGWRRRGRSPGPSCIPDRRTDTCPSAGSTLWSPRATDTKSIRESRSRQRRSVALLRADYEAGAREGAFIDFRTSDEARKRCRKKNENKKYKTNLIFSSGEQKCAGASASRASSRVKVNFRRLRAATDFRYCG